MDGSFCYGAIHHGASSHQSCRVLISQKCCSHLQIAMEYGIGVAFLCICSIFCFSSVSNHNVTAVDVVSLHSAIAHIDVL